MADEIESAAVELPELRVITLRQPWATLMAMPAKGLETRSWRTHYRGWIAIHAGKFWDEEQEETIGREPFATVLGARTRALPLGFVVAFGRLAEIYATSPKRGRGMSPGLPPSPAKVTGYKHEREFGDYSQDRYAWHIQDVIRPAEPIALQGVQGIALASDDLRAELARLIDERSAHV